MIAPFGMTGMPGSNPTGTNTAVPTASANNTPSLGSQQGSNPMLPQFPGGSTVPPITSSLNAFTGATQNPALIPSDSRAITGFKNAGFESGIAAYLVNFLKSGAGFNPQVAQALIDAMQPGVQRKEADILEHFSGMGLRSGTPAAVAYGDFLSQQQLNEGQIFASMYEQSVQNYMNVLLSGKRDMKPGGGGSGFDATMQAFAMLIGANNSRNHQ